MKLVIISGVSGALGNTFLSKYGRQNNVVVYGISRKAVNFSKFIDAFGLYTFTPD